MRKLLLCALPGLLLACPPEPPSGCQSAAECNDSNACTVDSCDASECKNVAVNLNDQVDCTDDTCDPVSGVISHDAQDNLCDDSVGCTVDVCDPGAGCGNTANDNLCNGTDVCDPIDDCQPVGNQSNPQINTVSPNNSLASAGFSGIVLTGSDLLAGATVTIGGVAATCSFAAAPTQLTCDLPAGNTVGRADIVVTNTDAQSFTLPNSWTNTGVLNESDQANELDFCVLQFPFTATASVNQPSDQTIFGQIFEAGLTDTTVGQAAPGVIAELGFGPQGSDPTISGAWSFSATQFNVETGINNNNDEYQGTLTIPVVGTFLYTYRFSLDNGINFTYCDQPATDGGSGSNGGLTFEANQLGTITVQ
jgi:hypothetical protein